MQKPRFILSRLVLPGLVLLAVGCSTPKHDLKTYHKLLQESMKPRLNVELPKTPQDPVTLTQCYALAILHNERLALQGESYVQALINKDRAWSAFLPTLSGRGSFTQEQQQPGQVVESQPITTITNQLNTSFTGPPFAYTGTGNITATTVVPPPVVVPPPENKSYSGSWAGSWNLFNGFRDYYSLQASRQSAEQQRQFLRDLERTVLFDVATAFHQVLLSEEAAKIIQSALALQQENLREVKARVEVGVARKLDVYQSEAQSAQFRVQLIDVELNVHNARELLSFLIDHRVEGPLTEDVQMPDEVPPLEDLMHEAARTRPDLIAATKAIEVADASIKVAFGGFAPNVSLNAIDTFYRRPGPIGVQWSYAIDAIQPVFRGGQTLEDIRQAYSVYRQAELSWQQLDRKVRQDVAISRASLVANGKRIKELEVELKAAEEALKQALAQYKVGLAINLDVLTAQDAQLAAQLQLQTERHRQKLQYLNLRRTLGHFPLPPGEGMEIEDEHPPAEEATEGATTNNTNPNK